MSIFFLNFKIIIFIVYNFEVSIRGKNFNRIISTVKYYNYMVKQILINAAVEKFYSTYNNIQKWTTILFFPRIYLNIFNLQLYNIKM